jgi:hypothetical protein
MEVDYSKALDKVKFWKSVIEASKDFTGTSPPSVFVGRFGYPKVYVGVLAPPVHHKTEDAVMLDSPERWYASEASIEDILNFRGQMIYSRFVSPIKRPSGKFMETTQEVAMSKRPADVEVQLKKQPKFKMDLNNWGKPIGSPAPIEKIRLTENPKIERKVDYLVSDTDMKAQDAVDRLYKYGLPVSRIQKIFSSGLLGVRFQRKLVPTRWGITAVDDILGKSILGRVKHNEHLGEIRLFHNEYIGNHYEILLIPGPYEYELVESWDVDSSWPKIGSDYEGNRLRKTYASKTQGAFYSGRLAVGEYLDKIKRQAVVLIVREVRPEYYAPLGIWQLRETVRGAFDKPFERFDNMQQAIDRICSRMIVGRKWIRKSELLKNLKEQTRLKQFLKV